MKVHRLPALALAVASLLAMAWVLGAGACSAPADVVPNCFVPNTAEQTADGGPDPCHCAIPAPYADSSCPCTSNGLFGDTGLTGAQVFHECMSLLPPDAGDAAEGGPISACNGQCVPLPPPGWTPVLLWSGAEASAPSCSAVGLTVVLT